MPWAARFPATEVDEANGDLDVNGNLDANAALQRLTDLRNVAIHEDNLTASPGTVHAFDGNTHETVEHTCSVFPGLSGGAGKPSCISFLKEVQLCLHSLACCQP